MPPDVPDKSPIENRQSAISPPPPPPPGEPAGAIAGQFLKFIGLIVTAAGALAILRMRHYDAGSHTYSHSIMYALMMPLGVALWIAGFYLVGRYPSSPPGGNLPPGTATSNPTTAASETDSKRESTDVP